MFLFTYFSLSGEGRSGISSTDRFVDDPHEQSLYSSPLSKGMLAVLVGRDAA